MTKKFPWVDFNYLYMIPHSAQWISSWIFYYYYWPLIAFIVNSAVTLEVQILIHGFWYYYIFLHGKFFILLFVSIFINLKNVREAKHGAISNWFYISFSDWLFLYICHPCSRMNFFADLVMVLGFFSK